MQNPVKREALKTATANSNTLQIRAEKKRWKLRENWQLYLMIAIPLSLIVIFLYVPMYGIVSAFQNYRPDLGYMHSEFVGLKWFYYLFSMPDFKEILYNTVVIALLKIFFGQLVPLVFALLLNEVTRTGYKRVIQTLVYLPHFLSWVIIGGIFIDLLSTKGIVNQILGVFGVEPIFFLGSNQWFRFTLVFTDVWKEFGWGSILYLSALTAIDPTLYEAAVIDGAGRLKQTRYVTLPGIMPTIVLLACLSLGGILSAGFEQVLILYNPAVYKTGDILDTFMYRAGLLNAQFSLATALGLFKSGISFVLILTSYALADRFANYKIL